VTEHLFAISEAQTYLNVSRVTINRWQAKGFLHPVYTPGGHRRFRESDLRAALGLTETVDQPHHRVVVYARVSTRKQAEAGNLQRQEERLVTYAVKQGYQVVATLTEIASGVNERRPKLRQAIQLITDKEAGVLIVEFQDRLARFGYEYLQWLVNSQGGSIEIVEAMADKAPNEELVEDLIAIVTSFSARIYGRRGGRHVTKKVGQVLSGALHDPENNDTGDHS
jgi:putative resolvase